MTEIDTAGARARHTAPPEPDDGLGQPTALPPDSRRERIRAKPVVGQCYRVGVFVAGLLCIALGVALAVLPGPLTIPPVLLGLWIWSTEFRFAKRFFESFKAKAHDAWAHAKRHPTSSAAITIGGLVAAGTAMWAVVHFELVDKAKSAVGL
jgi:putative transmembrane protein PGPGW